MSMELSRHDRTLLAVTVGVLLFGLALLPARKQIDAIRTQRRAIASLEEKVSLQKELIGARTDWEARYDDVKGLMHVFAPNDQVATKWLSIRDNIATRNHLSLIQASQPVENVVSGVSEMLLEVRNWEGSLESLVHFMHDLESEGVMLELRELRVMPVSGKQGILKGSFQLACAYLRADSATASGKDIARAEPASEPGDETTEPDAAPQGDAAELVSAPPDDAPASGGSEGGEKSAPNE